MPANALRLLLMPGSLPALWRDLWSRDRDPRLDDLRWRLHQRILAISCLLNSAFFIISFLRGHWDETGIGALASLGAWAWLRRHPQHNRAVARIVLGYFIFLAANAALRSEGPSPSWALLAMMALPVYGALVDGMLGGAVAALLAVGTGVLVLLQGHQHQLLLVQGFSVTVAICLYATSLAHAWLFHGLVARRRASAQAVAETAAATSQLALTLSRDVTEANVSLHRTLDQGLDGLTAVGDLVGILAHARRNLPEALPRGDVDPNTLLSDLRRAAHRFYLFLAVIVALAAMAFILCLGQALWSLAALVALSTGLLLWRGRREARWRWRLHAFLAATFAAIVADVLLSAESPPAASLVFLPLLVFYAGMLDSVKLAALLNALGLGLLASNWTITAPMEGYPMVLLVIGLMSLTLLAVVAATLPLYRDLLADLGREEDQLARSLAAYRRLVSTLFHDLANPLAVLQGLGALPKALQTADDLPRARRMAERLQAISDSARFSANSQAGRRTVAFRALAEELRDLFRERLRERSLSFQTQAADGLLLKHGGSLLRDSILGSLLGNAIRYSPPAGRVQFSAETADGGVWLRLLDDGPGFPGGVLRDLAAGLAPQPQPDPQGALGQGFSLLLAQAYARDLGGRLILANRAEGGAQAELWLPD